MKEIPSLDEKEHWNRHNLKTGIITAIQDTRIQILTPAAGQHLIFILDHY